MGMAHGIKEEVSFHSHAPRAEPLKCSSDVFFRTPSLRKLVRDLYNRFLRIPLHQKQVSGGLIKRSFTRYTWEDLWGNHTNYDLSH